MAEELKPVYLLTGGDRPKVRIAIARLRKHFDESAIEHRWAVDSSGSDTVAACNALGLFASGEGRLVIVEDVDGRRNNEGRLVGGWKEADIAAVVEYLAGPAPATVLALVGEEVKKDSHLAKTCAKAGQVLSYEVAKRGLPGWVAKQFERHGARADQAACRLLVELVGENPDELAIEAEKLVVWAAGEEIGEREVGMLVASRAERPPYHVTDAWGRRDVKGVLRAARSVIDWSGDPPARTLPRIAGALAVQVRRVQACRKLDADGVRPREAATRLKIRDFQAERAFQQSEKFSESELEDAVVRLAELDFALKGGSRLPEELELERALVAVTRSDEAPGRETG